MYSTCSITLDVSYRDHAVVKATWLFEEPMTVSKMDDVSCFNTMYCWHAVGKKRFAGFQILLGRWVITMYPSAENYSRQLPWWKKRMAELGDTLHIVPLCTPAPKVDRPVIIRGPRLPRAYPYAYSDVVYGASILSGGTGWTPPWAHSS